MNQLQVSTRLALNTALFALLLAIVGGIGLHGIQAGNDSLRTVYDDRVVPLGQLGQIQRLMEASQLAVEVAVQQKELSGRDAAAALADSNRSAIDSNWAAYMATQLTTEEAALARQFETERAAYLKQGLGPVLQALRQQDFDRAQQLARDSMAQGAAQARVTLEKLMALQVTVAKQEHDDAVTRYDHLRLGMMLAIGIGLAVATALGLQLSRSLNRQLGAEPAAAAAVAQAVSLGDLSLDITLRPGDQHSLMASMQQMQASLRQTVGTVRRDADGVATASSEIAQGTLDLSQRTEEQASALQQTAASMEALTGTVRQNADSAQMARQLADGAAATAVRGGQVVNKVVETMKGIEGSSRRIADIIGVIDGIAFQTNILALNAAVEAARAGEEGRGFAVVASEVRNLAKRSADAAKEVKVLINESVERVDAGTVLAAQAGGTMKEVVDSIARVKDLVGEISAACVEQSTGVSQVSEAVTQMDQVTQQNAALVEQSSAAAESLKKQARNLQDAVSVFRIGDEPAQVGPRAKAPAVTARTKRPGPVKAPMAAMAGAGDWTRF